MLVPSYKFEHLTRPLVMEDGTSFLILLPALDLPLSSWGSVIYQLPRSQSVHVFPLHLLPLSPLQALKDSKVVEIVDEKVRRREEPEKWPLPGPPIVDYSQTDFSQLLNCPEFVPRQHYQKETGRYPAGMWMPPCCPCPLAIRRRAGGMRISPFHPLESAPGSPRAVTPVPTKTEEVSNLKTLPKGLSASLPDLDSENWIEVKKRPRPSPARPKVSEACHAPEF